MTDTIANDLTDGETIVYRGNCLDVLRDIPDSSVHAIVTDPPYGLANTSPAQVADTITRWVAGERDYMPSGAGFMGKAWDAFVPPVAVWDECLRVLKPGGHVLAFAGSRTVDLMTLGLRLAGFDIRDSIAWLYGSGFPKSLDVSKAIDKHLAPKEPVDLTLEYRFTEWARSTGVTSQQINTATNSAMGGHYLTAASQPAIPTREMLELLRPIFGQIPEWIERVVDQRDQEKAEARARQEASRFLDTLGPGRGRCGGSNEWAGWGTALKPSHEPVVCARKPLNTVLLGEEADRLHHLLGGLLWLSLSPAKRAELISPSSPAGQHGATCVSALVSAALDTSPDASDETATFSSPALASTSLSIASSWSATLGALSARTRTSTTSTASSTTTALRTLNSLLGPITSQTTMPKCGCLLGGPSSPAPSVASSSSDEWARWLHTLSASVPATATEGIALAVASALAQVAGERSDAQAEASSAPPTATTGAAASRSAFEPVVVARKPFPGTVANNVLEHGTGAMNIDGCRIGNEVRVNPPAAAATNESASIGSGWRDDAEATVATGRWPANVVLDESQAAELDSDTGGASRFFYVAKADSSERPRVNGIAHSTVKPLALMRWLVRLVTPPGGTVLDPFAGSGTTLEAARLEGFACIGVEREGDYLALIRARIARTSVQVERDVEDLAATPADPHGTAPLF